MNFGRAISTLRKRFGLSQREFATVLDISPAFLSMLESDKKRPSKELIVKISNYFDIPASAFLYEAIKSNKEINKGETKRIINEVDPILSLLLDVMIKDFGKRELKLA